MSRALVPCGTYTAYQRHKRRGEVACDACLAANNTYHREVRARNPAYDERQRQSNRAHQRALRKLAAEYPERYRELLQTELTALTVGEVS